ncbi:hypothetical protein SALINJAH_288 [Bacillus phage SalinJah]|uniref:Uncharacterized protein n=1 Tax=Bacillus phage SalinJah TaxID=1837830 RepID=A0A173GBQ9_9CAUD|nr:hypothetical protein SALINJAH_288 [Bacillus phage SalinJah]ANH50645.1 hypothetical protein SALINJAH_288 [Bacillus phage SalinJah]
MTNKKNSVKIQTYKEIEDELKKDVAYHQVTYHEHKGVKEQDTYITTQLLKVVRMVYNAHNSTMQWVEFEDGNEERITIQTHDIQNVKGVNIQ